MGEALTCPCAVEAAGETRKWGNENVLILNGVFQIPRLRIPNVPNPMELGCDRTLLDVG